MSLKGTVKPKRHRGAAGAGIVNDWTVCRPSGGEGSGEEGKLQGSKHRSSLTFCHQGKREARELLTTPFGLVLAPLGLRYGISKSRSASLPSIPSPGESV
jgi:hypothetical protein